MSGNKNAIFWNGISVPVHVGVIMDGNGRWAKKRGMPRKYGHREGAKTFRTITRHAKEIGINISLFMHFPRKTGSVPQMKSRR